MARQQVNVRLSSYTVAQLKDLASRFDMSESTVIMLAIDRLARDTEADRMGKSKGSSNSNDRLPEEGEDQENKQ